LTTRGFCVIISTTNEREVIQMEKRNELNKSLYELIKEGGIEILDHEYETEAEWGFIEVIDKYGREVKYVFTDDKLNPIQMYVEGIQQWK
jgi:ketol-acid reductoisomerase